LYLETDNGDNPPIVLDEAQLFYPISRIYFKASPDGKLALYYGQAEVSVPRYDLSLIAPQVLSAEHQKATLDQEETLRKAKSWSAWDRTPAGALFWLALIAVVVGLLFVISRLLPKPPEAKT
jgi:hypothetical protein